MGGSSSKTSIKNERNIKMISKTELNMVAKDINKTVNNVSMDQASKCESSLSQDQLFELSNNKIIANDDINISTNQEQSGDLTFDCVVLSKMKGKIASKAKTQIMGAIEQAFSSKAITEMDNNAASKAKNKGLFKMGGSSSASEVENEVNFTSRNEKTFNIEMIVENVIKNNLDMEQSQKCIAKGAQTQQAIINGNLMKTKGAFNVDNDQSQVLEMTAECILKSTMGLDIATNVATQLGVDIETSEVVRSKADVSSKAKSKSSNSGLITGLFDFSGLMGSSLSLIPIVIILAILMFMSGGGSGSSSSMGNMNFGKRRFGGGYDLFGGDIISFETVPIDL